MTYKEKDLRSNCRSKHLVYTVLLPFSGYMSYWNNDWVHDITRDDNMSLAVSNCLSELRARLLLGLYCCSSACLLERTALIYFFYIWCQIGLLTVYRWAWDNFKLHKRASFLVSFKFLEMKPIQKWEKIMSCDLQIQSTYFLPSLRRIFMNQLSNQKCATDMETCTITSRTSKDALFFKSPFIRPRLAVESLGARNQSLEKDEYAARRAMVSCRSIFM